MYSGFQLTYMIILFLVAFFSIFLCVKNGRKQQEFICFYLIITFCLEFLMYIFQIYFNSSTNFGLFYNIYILFCALFFLNYFNKKQVRELMKINNVVFGIFGVFYIYYIFKNYKEVNQVIGICFALLYILYGLFWLYGKLKYPNLIAIWDEPRFWISCGFLFWGVFFILRVIPRYLLYKINNEGLIIFQSIFFTINIIFYLFFFVSLIKYNRLNGKA